MTRKALILDLDNTIYPVASIGEDLFRSLFLIISESGAHSRDMDLIRKEIMRKPFEKVAGVFHFSEGLKHKCIALLEELTYQKAMTPFEDYAEVKKLPCKKYLVTAGFTKLQESKVRQLGIEKDFDEIHIIDTRLYSQTKKDVFRDIIKRHTYDLKDVLAVGDDPDSEIQAAKELGIDSVVYNKINLNQDRKDLTFITDFGQLSKFM